MRFLRRVTLVAMGALAVSCGKQEVNENPQQGDNTVTMSVTVGFGDDAGTKALDVDFVNKTAVKTFAEGDRIAVIYKNASHETVKAEGTICSGAGTSSAMFTVTLSDPDNTQAVRYIYPAAMAKGTVSPDAEIDDDGTIDFTNLYTQDGSLATLGSTLDLCTYDAASWTSGTLPAGTLANRLTICAFTLKDRTDGSTITGNLAQVTVSDGTNNYVVEPEGTFGDVMYVAMLPVTTASALEIVGTAAPYVYVKIATSRTYAAGTFNNLALRMTRAVNLSALTSDYKAKNGDVLTGTTSWYVRIPSGVTVTLYEANILSSGIICAGTATIILMGSNTVTGGTDTYKGAIGTGEYGHTLTITGTGSLHVSAEGQENKAGIGPSGSSQWSNVVINGGTITAIGGTNGAGIGSAGSADFGKITINGGTITATGGPNGAGIGTGGSARGESIAINGGTITAIGGTNGAGIGTGGTSSARILYNININGGTITATGGTNGAGIGTGSDRCEFTNIKGGTVTATGGSGGAGIGSGSGRCDYTNVTGGTVIATGGSGGAGIGSGKGTCYFIKVTNTVTKVTATKGEGALHSIGKGSGRVDSVTIGGVTGAISESPYTYEP